MIMAAAVANYTPVRPAKTKIKSGKDGLTIKLKPTTDILKWAGTNKNPKSETCPERSRRIRNSKFRRRRLVIGFALEDRNLRQNAEKKLRDKNLDMIIANTPAAIGSDKISVRIKTPNQNWLKLPKAAKVTIARRIITLVEKIKKER